METFASLIGVQDRQLRRWLDEGTSIKAPSVDRILVALGLPHVWQEDPELKRFYDDDDYWKEPAHGTHKMWNFCKCEKCAEGLLASKARRSQEAKDRRNKERYRKSKLKSAPVDKVLA